MGKLFCIHSYCIVLSKSDIYLHNFKYGNVQHIRIPENKVLTIHKNGNASNNSKFDEIVSCIISPDLQYIAVVCVTKKLIIWDLKTLQIIKQETVPRCPTAIAFTSDYSTVLVIDKTGDVYRYSISDDKEQNIQMTKDPVILADAEDDYLPDIEAGPESQMGHLSMLLDIVVTTDGRFVATCDRDEKIRISNYPNMYNIHSFCLGHKEFVSQILEVPGINGRLISGSGDGTVRLWNYHTGKCLSTVNVKSNCIEATGHFELVSLTLEESVPLDVKEKAIYAISRVAVHMLDNKEIYLAVALYGVAAVHIYAMNVDCLQFCQEFALPSPAADVVFIDDSSLVVLLQNPPKGQNPFVIMKFDQKLNRISVINSHPLLDFGTEHMDDFSDTRNPLDIQVLYKQKHDNFAEYLVRKEARISSKASSSSTSKGNNCKKAKLK